MDKDLPSESEIQRQKLILEVELLKLQQREHQRRWYQRPVILFAILPSLVAAATLGFQFYTGFYENSARLASLEKKEALQVKAELVQQKDDLQATEKYIKTSQTKLEKDKQSLAAVTNDIEMQSAKLTDERTRLKDELAQIESVKLSLENAKANISEKEKEVFEKQQALDEELQSIEAQKQIALAEMVALKSKIAQQTVEFENTKRKLKYASVDAYIKAISESDISPQNDSAEALIRYLASTETFTSKDILDYFQNYQSKPMLYLNLLYIQYRAFNDKAMVDRILDFAESQVDNIHIWGVLGTVQWESSDQIKAWKRYLELAKEHQPTHSELADMYLEFGYPSEEYEGLVRESINDDELYFYSVKTAFQIAMDELSDDIDRDRAVLGLKGLAPSLALVAMTKIYESSNSSQELKFEMYNYIKEAADDILFDIQLDRYDPTTRTFGERPTSKGLSKAIITHLFPYDKLEEISKWDKQTRASILKAYGI